MVTRSVRECTVIAFAQLPEQGPSNQDDFTRVSRGCILSGEICTSTVPVE